MLSQDISPDLSRYGVYVADGYGIRIHVQNRHLSVAGGHGSNRRAARFHRATHGLKRLVVLGHSGYITLEAIRWVQDAQLALIQIDSDGRVLISSRLGLNQPGLRRAQAQAATNDVGLDITRTILRHKIEGQAQVAATLDADIADTISSHIGQLNDAPTQNQLRLVEASAAVAYWSLWADIPIRFASKHEGRVPEHWKTVGPRRSPVSGSPRRAANPVHAILNYLYALLEAEARIACLAVGLDPGIGILHTDQRDRDSLALDLMEAIRPDIDAYVLKLLGSRTFSADDFHETRRGACRILQPLTHELAATLLTWAQRLGPIAEHTASLLHPKSERVQPLPTPLTQDRRKKGRDQHRRRRGTRAKPPQQPGHRCIQCGAPTKRRAKTCGQCADEVRRQPDHTRLVRLKELRDLGQDPAHGGSAAEKRRETNIAHQQKASVWDRANERPDPDIFTREILPALREVSAGEIARTTGLSAGYCSMIKRGLRIPHPRHWKVLASLLD